MMGQGTLAASDHRIFCRILEHAKSGPIHNLQLLDSSPDPESCSNRPCLQPPFAGSLTGSQNMLGRAHSQPLVTGSQNMLSQGLLTRPISRSLTGSWNMLNQGPFIASDCWIPHRIPNMLCQGLLAAK
ncbi:hypothetical protein chiPu_0026553 [Chiloscyllium punctatum]|uniref:Uncharacterized protein n=1 Tax=Chiloscyllium punctatum TaxID=137246 RepID=A0A401TJN0_CHIPU|nr:hypothetical protein [Chiloscyllium punctatum]